MDKQKEFIPVKACFSHIGGKLGMLLMESFIERGWITKANPDNKHFHVTPKGEREFSKLGVDLTLIEK